MIDYQDLIDRNFTREDVDDPVWYNQHGFHYYILYRKFENHFSMEYDIMESSVDVSKLNENGTINCIIKVYDIEMLDKVITTLEYPTSHTNLCSIEQMINIV